VEQQNTTALAAANNQGQAADIFVPSVPASDDVASASASGAPAGAASAWNPPPLPGQPGTSAAKTNTPPDQPTTNTALPAKPAHPWSPAVASPPAALAGSPGSGANSSSTKPSPITSPIATQATNTAKAETRPKTPSLTTPVTQPRIAAGVAAASGLKIPATEEPGTGLHWPFYLLLLVLLLGVLAMCLAAWAKRKQLS
jgi:hypothetical protein